MNYKNNKGNELASAFVGRGADNCQLRHQDLESRGLRDKISEVATANQ